MSTVRLRPYRIGARRSLSAPPGAVQMNALLCAEHGHRIVLDLDLIQAQKLLEQLKTAVRLAETADKNWDTL